MIREAALNHFLGIWFLCGIEKSEIFKALKNKNEYGQKARQNAVLTKLNWRYCRKINIFTRFSGLGNDDDDDGGEYFKKTFKMMKISEIKTGPTQKISDEHSMRIFESKSNWATKTVFYSPKIDSEREKDSHWTNWKWHRCE